MSKTLETNNTALLIIDVQEAFRTVISDFDSIVANTVICAKAFEVLGLPVIISEQYPRGLGKTAGEITDVTTNPRILEKSTFSAARAIDFSALIEELNIETFVVTGVETHVCVNQTVHDLLELDLKVHVVEDAIGSRSLENRLIGLKKMIGSGAIPTSTEMALFELLVDSKNPSFKEIQALVK